MTAPTRFGVLAIAALLILGGCSGMATTTTSDPAGTAAGAANPAPATSSKTSEVAGQPVDKDALIDKMMTAYGSVKTLSWTTEGSTEVAGKTSKLSMVAVLDQSVKDHPKTKMTMGTAAGDIVTIIDGDTYYLQMGGTWYKADQASFAKTGVELPSSSDPGSTLADRKSSFQKAVFIGDDTVEGAATKHYRLTSDASDTTTGIEQSASAKPTADSLAYDVWLDSSSMMRKFSIDLGGLTMVGTISKINEPVTIDIPADAKPFPGTS